MKQITPIKPILQKGLGIPDWYRAQGSEVKYIGMDHANDPDAKTIILAGNGIEIRIHRDSTETAKQIGWLVNYTINHSIQSYTGGTIWFSPNDLKTAFGLSDECDPETSHYILNRCGGDVAYHGRYIRWQKYLNIPGPGQNCDGDPNVSILITEMIQDGIQSLMQK